MSRLFLYVLVSLMLLPAPKKEAAVRPVFFSMLFPQLIPQYLLDGQPVWEVFL